MSQLKQAWWEHPPGPERERLKVIHDQPKPPPETILYPRHHRAANHAFGGRMGYFAAGGSQLAVTTSLALTVSTWHTYELSVVVGNSGSYDLHVDGQSVLSASADTQPGSSAFVDVVRIGKNVNSSMLPMFDDLVIDDQAGAFLTDWKINTVFPSADSVVDGTPSTGSDNYAVVDENPANGDTDYVGSTSGDEDRFSFPSVSGTNVVAVVVTAVTRQTDASPFDITLIANQAGAPQAIGSSDYVAKSEVFETNPDTGLAWEISEVNSAEFGYKVT